MKVGRKREFWLEPNSSTLATADTAALSEKFLPNVLFLETPFKLENVRTASRVDGADILVTDELKTATSAKAKGRITALEVVVRDREDHEKVLNALRVNPDYLIVTCPDWKIIPLENLIADATGKSKILARTTGYEESKAALEVLELGVDGVVLSSQDQNEIQKTHDLVSSSGQPTIEFSTAKIETVRSIKSGSRVCVDTTELIRPGEGMLVGCSSQALFLVEAEVHTNPHVNPRPFRVNAGPVSMYVLTADRKTRYLSELETGETVLIVDSIGGSRSVDVARVKIERRPLVLVEAIARGSKKVKTILQNAETVRLVGPRGSTPASMLKPGDEVFVRIEEGGRHFGSLVKDEMIIEK